MSGAPILLFQMQRMGDLVLTFPLLGWLGGLFPANPVWVVGERLFFEPLMPLSPPATYFSYSEAPDFTRLRFHLVINLSHRPEAAALAGKMRCDALIGPYLDQEGRLRIRGDWQLYRASLTHNNRYNLFHWADLNALDLVPGSTLLRTAWPTPRPVKAPSKLRIGLFLGASEPQKHPDAAFWAALAKRLLHLGHSPVLLGGPAEQALGAAVAAQAGIAGLDLCGKFTVDALARFIAELDLFVTPDTGPMHIAAWTGTPVLNLSLGPVNAWETGPFSPGHHVVRSSRDCVGCWLCRQERALCKEDMSAGKIAACIASLPGGEVPPSLHSLTRGLELSRSCRGARGLYALTPLLHSPPVRKTPPSSFCGREESPEERRFLSLFWQRFFGRLFGAFSEKDERDAWDSLRENVPDSARRLRDAASSAAPLLARLARKYPATAPADSDFWRQSPEPLRPLSGYIQMFVANELGSRSSFVHALSLLERVVGMADRSSAPDPAEGTPPPRTSPAGD